jgi:ADP-ribosylglycohydrolase
MDRRQFLYQSALIPAAAYAASSSATESSGGQGGGNHVSLREKFFGCIAGAHVGSALKGPCEGWDWQDIQAKYGTIDHLMGYQDYHNGWNREPGTTEDGIERQKMMITAIIEKRDRVNAEDLRRIWVRDMKPEAAGMISEPWEGVILSLAKSGIPACDMGRYHDAAVTDAMARACHPLGLINAGDIEAAVEDVFEVGQVYNVPNSRGIQWAAVTGIAIASATKPGATVDSVIGDVLKGHPRFVTTAIGWIRFGEDATPSKMPLVAEIERGLELTKNCKDFREMRVAFDKVYYGKGNAVNANEVVTKAVCVFRMCKGNPKEAMISSVNMGRDTDCLSAIASGISGALSGASAIPQEWIKQVDYATTKIPVTNSRRTIQQHADGLYEAYQARLRRMRTFVDEMERA